MFAAMRRRVFLVARNLNIIKCGPNRSSLVKEPEEKEPDVVNFTIIGSTGLRYKLQGNEGWDMVDAIQRNNLQGEFQDFGVCFGTTLCRTCHVYFKPEDLNKLPKIKENSDEIFYLEDIPNYIPGSSRLACHVKLQKLMNNMEIRRPPKGIGLTNIPT